MAAAVAGNALIGKDDLAWLYGLRQPRMQLPLPGFAAVGVVYYVVLGCVIYRATDRRDRIATRLAVVVLALNEVWNLAFFGRRSVRAGFLGIVAFLVPLTALQVAVSRDRTSSLLLAPYTAWVVGYDVPWTLQLWRLNRGRAEGPQQERPMRQRSLRKKVRSSSTRTSGCSRAAKWPPTAGSLQWRRSV
jgi:translocator protein